MRWHDRREFFQESARWAAALSAAGLACPAFGDNPKPEPAGLGSPAERIRVAVIGANRKSGRGYEHVGMAAGRNNVEVVAVCDCDDDVVGDALNRAEKQQGRKPGYQKDLRRVLDDRTIDAVTIATPNHWHALAAIWAMQAGKHVYVEKPVSHNVWEGRKIVEAARKYNRICQTGTQARSASAMRAMIDFVRAGKIGQVSIARALCYKLRPSIGQVEGDGAVPPTIDYDLWCGPGPLRPPRRKRLHYDWHWQWDFGNGDIGNQGIHQMDVARWGLNKSALPQEVVSLGGRFGSKDDGETPNTMLSRLDYGDCRIIFEVRGFPTLDVLADTRGGPVADKRLIAKVGNVFHGTKGFVITANYGEAVAVDNDGSIIEVFRAEKGDDHFGNFCQAVRSGRIQDLTADIEEGHVSSALCHLANLSYRLGQDAPLDSAPAIDDALERMKRHLAANGVSAADLSCRIGATLTIDPTRELVKNHPPSILAREYRNGFVVPSAV